MLKDYRIVVDAMGGDNAPKAPVEGAVLAMQKYPGLSVVFTGREPEIRKALEGLEADPTVIRSSIRTRWSRMRSIIPPRPRAARGILP